MGSMLTEIDWSNVGAHDPGVMVELGVLLCGTTILGLWGRVRGRVHSGLYAGGSIASSSLPSSTAPTSMALGRVLVGVVGDAISVPSTGVSGIARSAPFAGGAGRRLA